METGNSIAWTYIYPCTNPLPITQPPTRPAAAQWPCPPQGSPGGPDISVPQQDYLLPVPKTQNIYMPKEDFQYFQPVPKTLDISVPKLEYLYSLPVPGPPGGPAGGCRDLPPDRGEQAARRP